MQRVRTLFSRFGFAQLAGAAAVMLISLMLAPLVTPEAWEKLFSSVGPSLLLLLSYVPNVVFLIVFWMLIRKIPKSEWQKEPLSFGALLKIFVMMYAVSSLFNLIGTAISRAAPAGGTQQLDLIEKVVNTKLLVGFLIPAVIGPVVEELIFRKLMIDRLHNYGETTVIVFTALCFGLFHGNLTQFVYATSVGLFLGYVYCKTGKVIDTIIMHILLNTLSSMMLLLAPMNQGNLEDGAILVFVVAGLLLLVGLMFVTGIILIIRHLKRRDIVLDNSTSDAIPKDEILKTVYGNPGVALLFIYSMAGVLIDLFKIPMPF